MPDPIQNPYSDSLEDLYDASGEVETIINGGTPTAAQSTLLNFLQNDLKNAIQTAAQADGVQVPGEQP